MRCFLAIDLPSAMKEKLTAIQAELEGSATIKFVEKENLHITLFFFGEIGDKKLKEIKEVISSRLRTFQKFQVKLKGIGVFPSQSYVRVIWVGVEASRLEELHHTLIQGLQQLGFYEDRPFVPHLTIGRVKRVLNRENLMKVLDKFRTLEFGEFEVGEIKLMKSILTPKGPIYEDIFKFELKATGM